MKKEQNNGSFTRTTVFLTDTQSYNLDVLAIKLAKPKGEIIREALNERLSKEGISPDKKVHITLNPQPEPSTV